MSQPPDLNQAYRTWQGAHTTEANIMEMLMNTINEVQRENIRLRARVVELEKPLKKLDKVTETVPTMPPGANPPKPPTPKK